MRYLVVVVLLLVVGCTTVSVRRVDFSNHRISFVCIKENHRVRVSDFVDVVRNGFKRHGIETEVYEDSVPKDCEYVLTYTARRGWDIVPFMNYAELRLKNNRKTIGYASYRHAGGFALNKWASTEEKMNPVIDKLLSGYASNSIRDGIPNDKNEENGKKRDIKVLTI